MKILTLILTLITFQFFITGCNGGVLFGGDSQTKPSGREGVSEVPLLGESSQPAENMNTASLSSTNNKHNEDNGVRGPSVKFIVPPKNIIVGVNINIVFEIIKGDSDIVQVNCFFNGQSVPCDESGGTVGSAIGGGNPSGGSLDGGTISIGPMDTGRHRLQIVATDREGQIHERSEEWTVNSQFNMEEQTLQVLREKDKIDVLFVVDNSSSMKYEQQKIGEGFSNFIAQLNGLDWRIGIITTDGNEKTLYLDFANVSGDASPETVISDWTGGRLASLTGVDFWDSNVKKYPYLTPNVKDVQKVFSKNIERRELGSNFEQGIYTTYRAVERAVANNTKENRVLNEFFRQEAALAVVVISDEDDSGSLTRNNPENLIAHVKRSFGEDKIFQFHSIIAHTQSCLDGKGEDYGYNYEKLSRLTGGIVGDICSDNYGRILSDIGNGMSNLTKTYEMKCVPQDTDNDGVVNFQVAPRVSGLSLPGYTISGSHVEFDAPLEIGDYQLTYYCL